MKNYLVARLSEASTLRGLLILGAGLCGYDLSNDDAVQLMAAFNIVAGIVGAALPDHRRG